MSGFAIQLILGTVLQSLSGGLCRSLSSEYVIRSISAMLLIHLSVRFRLLMNGDPLIDTQCFLISKTSYIEWRNQYCLTHFFYKSRSILPTFSLEIFLKTLRDFCLQGMMENVLMKGSKNK